MDTKERGAPSRRRKQTGRTRTNGAGQARRKPTPESRSKAVQERRKRRDTATAPKRPRTRRRVVRADIPEVVYTMPKALHRGTFVLRLVSVAAVVVALMLAVSVFFRVETVTVLGAEKYTAWMVQEASGIQTGDGLLTLSRARAAGKIRSALPYVDEVKIDIRLPGTVCIELTELEVTYAVCADDNSWWLISADGRAVEKIDSSAVSGYTRILGLQIQDPEMDQAVIAAVDVIPTEATGETDQTQPSGEETLPTQAVETNAQRLQAVLNILQVLESNRVIGDIASVNVTSLADIQLQYGQRFQVRLGNAENLAYKIGYMAQAVNQMEEYQAGVIDVSFEYSDEGIFTPET